DLLTGERRRPVRDHLHNLLDRREDRVRVRDQRLVHRTDVPHLRHRLPERRPRHREDLPPLDVTPRGHAPDVDELPVGGELVKRLHNRLRHGTLLLAVGTYPPRLPPRRATPDTSKPPPVDRSGGGVGCRSAPLRYLPYYGVSGSG